MVRLDSKKWEPIRLICHDVPVEIEFTVMSSYPEFRPSFHDSSGARLDPHFKLLRECVESTIKCAQNGLNFVVIE